MNEHYELIDEQEVLEIDSLVRRYRHKGSGATVFSVINDDENKVFGVTFRTPPPDSTGVPHILEHSVLAGSKKFPVKEPYIELIKSSLNTNANALTFPDRTTYPCASQNLADFYNLIDVYLDAVFHPLLPARLLAQEGWHYGLNDPGSPLSIKGVVYNEMKGVYSDPQSFLGRLTRMSLLPDTPYQYDSGGDPVKIPELTYDNFTKFHEVYYHPGNAFIFFAGDDPPEDRLALLQEYLKDFEPADSIPPINLQPYFDSPKKITEKFSAGHGNGSEASGFVSTNWLLPDNDSLEHNIAFEILGHTLLGTQGSPLRKLMLDSGLGEDLVASGFSDSLRQMFFSTGMKGVSPSNLDKIEPMVLAALEEIAEEGIDPGAISAAVNTLEFYLRERNTGGYPRGLVVMFQALNGWLFGRDPVDWLRYEEPLSRVKEKLEDEADYLENLLRTDIINNPHRVTVQLAPDPDLQAERQAEETAHLEEIKSSLSAQDLANLVVQNQTLKEHQETPDSPEALATIPALQLSDLDKENKYIPSESGDINGVDLLSHDLFTDGIVYLDLAFDLTSVEGDLLHYLPLYRRALLEMGTKKEDFVKLSQRIGIHTGGISARLFTSDIRESGMGKAWLIMRSKALLTKTPDLVAILEDILQIPDFANKDRFQQILVKEKASLETSLIKAGRSIVDRRLRSRYSPAAWVSEQISGIDYLFFIRDLANNFDKSWDDISETLSDLHKTLINANGLKINLTLPRGDTDHVGEQLHALIGNLPRDSQYSVTWKTSSWNTAEGLIIPTQVNYVGKSAPLYDLGYSLHGSIHVILKYLRTTWLWDKVRVQGGAYDASPLFGRQSGVLTLASYRDPNLLPTLEIFDGSAEFLRTADISPDEIRKSIIGAIGTIDAYQLPDAKGYVSLIRNLIEESDDSRQLIREQVLGTTLQDFRDFAAIMDEFRRQGGVAAVGSASAFETAHSDHPDYFSLSNIL